MPSKADIARRNRGRGKRNEKALADRLGGKREGIFGGEDISMGLFSVEAKSRKQFVGQGFMEQAERNCPKGKVPLVIVHILNQRRSNDLVMMRLSDFEDHYGKAEDEKNLGED